MRYSQMKTVDEIVDDAVLQLGAVAIVPVEYPGKVRDIVERKLARYEKEVGQLNDDELEEIEKSINTLAKVVVYNDPFFTLNFAAGTEKLGHRVGLISGLSFGLTACAIVASIFASTR